MSDHREHDADIAADEDLDQLPEAGPTSGGPDGIAEDSASAAESDADEADDGQSPG